MKVAIYGQYYQESTKPIIRDILGFFNEKKIEMVIEESFLAKIYEKELASRPYITFSSHKDLDSSFDIFISIGGDGTILRAATLVRDSGIPVLGINAGRLGFLATVQKDNIHEFLQFILEKKYTTSARTLLSLTCDPEIESIGELNFAMNDVTVNRKDTTSMITIETFLNGSYLSSYWADGLIISTPTGSTGYSLSCGGPVLTPDVSSLVLTPIAPHNLTARPLVIPDDTEIRLRVTGREDQFLVSLDSRTVSVKNESVLRIRKTPFKINMVEIPEESFLKRLRTKLLWGEDKRN
ncbi:MAG: NAD kinase [Flavobacterium sp.]